MKLLIVFTGKKENLIFKIITIFLTLLSKITFNHRKYIKKYNIIYS